MNSCTRGIDFIGLYPISLLIFLLIPWQTQKKGTFVPLIGIAQRKSDFVCFQYKYMAKISDICNELQKPQKIFVFFAFYMTIQRVCRVCNKFLKDTKRSSALYCGKRCKNKAVTLRKHESVLNEPKTAKTIDVEHPLYGAPNIYDLYKKGFEIQGQLDWHQRHSKHIREIDALKDKMRQIQLSKDNEKQAIQEKLAQSVLFVFTNIINNTKDKPQSGLMPITSNDLADF
jgi:hypothetical protein